MVASGEQEGHTVPKKIAAVSLLILFALTGTVAVRTFTPGSAQLAPEPFEPVVFDTDAALQRLSEAVQIPTISHQDPALWDPAPFGRFHAFLQRAYPRVHAALTREVVNGHALLYTWTGSDASAAPILLLAHQDVVPIAPGTEADWTHPPFSGEISEGAVWGRGTLDDKGSLIGILEAVEALLAAGFQPRAAVYLCFGHDEEIGGWEGAGRIAALLEERGVKAALCLDEGLAVIDGMIPGVDGRMSLIGVAEKGYLSVAVEARAPGGHSSAPPPETAIGRVARAVARLEDNPFPATLAGPLREMLETAAPEMRLPMRLVMANLWLFGPVVRRQLAAEPATNAVIRTTAAPTLFHAGEKENVLPQHARAVVNFRLLPGETVDSALVRIRETIGDAEVSVKPLPTPNEPSPVSRTDGPAWNAVAMSARQVFPDAPVAPGLLTGGTDCPHYEGVAENIYRFLPVTLNAERLETFHGTNEHIPAGDFLDAIRFYAQVIRNAAGG